MRIEPLGPQHDRSGFRCGVESLDRYFRHQAGQDARRNIAAAFVLVLPDGVLAGYYTVSSFAVGLAELPPDLVRRLPRYPSLPATLLGRLAVDARQQGNGHGAFLLADALHRALRSEIASFAVIVDAHDAAARRFYEQHGFLRLPGQEMKLFLSMADVSRLFSQRASGVD